MKNVSAKFETWWQYRTTRVNVLVDDRPKLTEKCTAREAFRAGVQQAETEMHDDVYRRQTSGRR